MENVPFVFSNDLRAYRGFFQKHSPAPMVVRKNTVLHTERAQSRWLYYILDGVVKISAIGHNGTERIIDFMCHDTVVGIDCLYPNQSPATVVTCMSDVEVYPLTAEVLRQMVGEDPAFAYDILLYCAKVLGQVTYQSGVMALMRADQKLANFLVSFLHTHNYHETGKIWISQEDIAAAINVSHAQLARSLRMLREQKVIDTGHRYIVILDSERLRKYC